MMMSPESVHSAMPPNKECEEEEEDVWSGDSENEEESGPSNHECDETDNNENGKEATGNCEDRVEEPKEGMAFDTPEEAYLYYSNYAKAKGFDVARRTSRKGKDGNLRDVGFECSRVGKPRKRTSNPVKPRPQTKIGCPAHVTVVIHPDGKWRLNRVALEHNHEQSPGKARFFKSNRVLSENVKRKLRVNDEAGIKLNKSYDALQIEAGGPDETPYLERDCRNYLDKLRRLRLVEGDAQAMHSYFMRMQADNSNFFFAMDLNDKGRLRNVFWADARSRAACKEFGDVVTFDTTYLVNKYEMPFAPFVGVNHHGQSILLGCGLISHEDTESFSWLFQTWKTCMRGCAPRAIITDQSVYTNAKVKEFHEQFAVGRLELSCKASKEDESEYVVKEWVTFGEGEERQRIQVPFTVAFDVETNETHCNCRLFESRGMVCRHQLMVWNDRGIERVPDKYILRRWCKNVKRLHTKIRISYDKSSASIEARRHDNLCTLFKEVVDLAEDSQEKYEKAMARLSELKRELMEDSVVCDSNVVVSLGDDTGPRIDSLGDEAILSKKSTNILDPEGVRRQGRPPCKRKQGLVEKITKKKIATKKKTLSKETAKEVDKNAVAHGVGTQESIVNVNGHPSYMGHPMWSNVMPHFMQANMAQGGSILPFSPTFCPTGTSMPQFMPSFSSSQSNMASLINGQVWRGQSTIVGNQDWGGGGQSNCLEDQSQYWRGPQPSLMQSQGQGKWRTTKLFGNVECNGQ